MLRRIIHSAFVITLTAVAACSPADPPADLAITNVTVIDAVNGVRAGQNVVMNNGTIVTVAEPGSPVNAEQVVDGTGKYLIPGLWDFHVHLTYDDAFTDAMAGLFLSYGITSVRDTGGPLALLKPVVDRLEAEGAIAPRVFFAGPLLDGEYVVYDGVNRPVLGIGNPDVETARENVAMLAEAGVDFVKIYEMISPEVFEALVSAANEHGLPMDGHVPLSMRARNVGPRVNSLEHLRNIEMDCAEEPAALLEQRRAILQNTDAVPGASLRSRLHSSQRLPAIEAYDAAECAAVIAAMATTIQVPTLRLNAMSLVPPFARDDWADALSRLPEAAAAPWTEMSTEREQRTATTDMTFPEWSLSLIGQMHEAGVPIGAGTDTPIGFAVPGYSLHNELEMLVRAGLSPIEALRSATLRPAEFFGLENEMGTVDVGRLADLVLLNANPLEDIHNTRTVHAVVTKGQLLTSEALAALIR